MAGVPLDYDNDDVDDDDDDVKSRSRQARGAVADGDVDDGKPWPGHPRVPRLRGQAPLTLYTRLRSLQQKKLPY